MKEATGELNSTVVVVMAVALLAAFFFSVLWPMIKTNMDQNSKCSAAVCGYTCDGDKTEHDGGSVKCCYTDKNTGKKTDLTCSYKG
jgi:hypothetical protein